MSQSRGRCVVEESDPETIIPLIAMDKQNSPLDNLYIASPCHASWENMSGSDRARFCGECRKNVYNISAMTRAEAESLLSNARGEVCVRYYQRADGTVMTQDCPVGVLTMRQRFVRRVSAVAASIIALFGGSALASAQDCRPMMGGAPARPHRVDTAKTPAKVDTVRQEEPEMLIMGEVAFTPEPDTTVRAIPPLNEPTFTAPLSISKPELVQITIPMILLQPLDEPVDTTPGREPVARPHIIDATDPDATIR